MKVLVVAEAPDGTIHEESCSDLPEEIRDAIERLRRLPDDVVRDAAMISALLKDFPDAGNHFLYGVYRDSGGQAPWKVFRRAVSQIRGEDSGGKEEELRRLRMLRKEEMEERAVVRKKAEEARRKKEEEKAMATIRREDLRRGQDVYVRVRYADQMKLRPARINEVMRAAVNVSIEGEDQPRTVRFNEIELSLDGSDKAVSTAPTLAAVPPAFAALGNGRGVQAVERRHPHVEVRRPHQPYEDPRPPSPPVPAQEAPQPTPAPVDTLGQVNAWIEQGSAMRESLVKQQVTLQSAMDDLAAEALRIEEALAAKKAELARVTALLSALDQMRAVAAA